MAFSFGALSAWIASNAFPSEPAGVSSRFGPRRDAVLTLGEVTATTTNNNPITSNTNNCLLGLTFDCGLNVAIGAKSLSAVTRCDVPVYKASALDRVLEHERTKQALSRVEQELATTKQDLATAKHDLTTTGQVLATTQLNLATAEQVLAITDQVLDTTQQNLVATEQELATTLLNLATSQMNLATAEQNLANANNEKLLTSMHLSEVQQYQAQYIMGDIELNELEVIRAIVEKNSQELQQTMYAVMNQMLALIGSRDELMLINQVQPKADALFVLGRQHSEVTSHVNELMVQMQSRERFAQVRVALASGAWGYGGSGTGLILSTGNGVHSSDNDDTHSSGNGIGNNHFVTA